MCCDYIYKKQTTQLFSLYIESTFLPVLIEKEQIEKSAMAPVFGLYRVMERDWLESKSVSILVHLKIITVQLLLSLVEFAELLGLSFTELLPLGVVSGETLETGDGVNINEGCRKSNNRLHVMGLCHYIYRN